VMFTDGLPNGVVANYNDSEPTKNFLKTGKCSHRLDPAFPMTGFMSQTNGFTQSSNGHDTNGIEKLGSSTVGTVSEGIITSPTGVATGCSYLAAETDIRKNLNQLPPTDLWGNRLDIGYQLADLTNAVSIPHEFGKAAMNAADNQVKTIRGNSNLGIVLYTIGYSGGSEAPDETWNEEDFERSLQYVLRHYADRRTLRKGAHDRSVDGGIQPSGIGDSQVGDVRILSAGTRTTHWQRNSGANRRRSWRCWLVGTASAAYLPAIA
jgi:hypothetical protein